jgi:hypothetical protein
MVMKNGIFGNYDFELADNVTLRQPDRVRPSSPRVMEDHRFDPDQVHQIISTT